MALTHHKPRKSFGSILILQRKARYLEEMFLMEKKAFIFIRKRFT